MAIKDSHDAFTSAAFLLLSPTVYGCVVFHTTLVADKKDGGYTLTGNLVDNGALDKFAY
jgi:hypothetical protein